MYINFCFIPYLMCNKNTLHFSIELRILIDTEISLPFYFETFAPDILIIYRWNSLCFIKLLWLNEVFTNNAFLCRTSILSWIFSISGTNITNSDQPDIHF